MLLAKSDAQVETAPLEFEFAQEPQQRELVETPESAVTDTPAENSPFLSDKNARAQDLNDQDTGQPMPFSEGVTDYRVFAGNQGEQESVQQQPTEEQTEQKEEGEQELDSDSDLKNILSGEDDEILVQSKPKKYQEFSPQILRGGVGRSTTQATFSDDANWDHKESSALAMGDVSLSTYAWDFAPYILAMKRKIKSNIYPPPAFYKMGAISGDSILRFRVQRNGDVTDLQVLTYNGHKALMETSVNAVKACYKFKPLPSSFPEKYLELNWTFVYSILK